MLFSLLKHYLDTDTESIPICVLLYLMVLKTIFPGCGVMGISDGIFNKLMLFFFVYSDAPLSWIITVNNFWFSRISRKKFYNLQICIICH